jgi:hypothetical protein
MIAYVVQFHDAYGHRDVRKVSRSSAGAEAYITSALAAASATDIVWESNRTYCSAHRSLSRPAGWLRTGLVLHRGARADRLVDCALRRIRTCIGVRFRRFVAFRFFCRRACQRA